MAWLLVHMLMHGEQPYAQRFREVLKAPASAKKGAALAEVVQLTPNQQLDRDLRQYLQKRLPWRQHHASLPPAPPEVSRRGLSRSEALVLLARLDAFKGDKARRAEDRLNLARNTPGGEAGVGAPAFWLGRYNQLQGDFVKAEELYLEATRIDPDNPDYLFGLVDLYWTDERTTWMEAAKSDRMNKTMAALVRIARSPYQLNAVAVHQMLAGDVPAALATTERACAVGSDCWICFHNRAAALFASGQVAQALQSERDAQLRQSESAAPRLVAMVRGALAFYSQAATDRESVQDQPTPGLIAP
jgi:tetratricopeptide (TPR) repeat protein